MPNKDYQKEMAHALIALVTDDGKTNADLKSTILTLLPYAEQITKEQQTNHYKESNDIWMEDCTESTECRLRKLLDTSKDQNEQAIRLSMVLDNTLKPPPYAQMMIALSNLATPADALFWAQENRDMLNACRINP